MTEHVQRLRDACLERCAEVGDPPCYELDRRAGVEPTWCSECRQDCGETVDEALDPDAVVAPLL